MDKTRKLQESGKKIIAKEIENLDYNISNHFNPFDDETHPYQNPKSKYEKSINAFVFLCKVAAVYNKFETVNIKGANKYIPYCYWSGGSWSVPVDAGHGLLSYPAGLYYLEEKDAKKSLEKYRKVWDEYWMIEE